MLLTLHSVPCHQYAEGDSDFDILLAWREETEMTHSERTGNYCKEHVGGQGFPNSSNFLLSLYKETFWPFNPFVMLKYCSVNIEHWSIKINITCVYVYNMKLQKNYTAAVTTVTPNPLCPPITKTMLRELESQKLFFQRQ